MYIYMYINIYMYIYVYMCIYTYICILQKKNLNYGFEGSNVVLILYVIKKSGKV